MQAWLEARGFWEMGGTVAALAALLLLALLGVLPADKKPLLRRPIGLFFVYLGLFALAQVFPPHNPNSAWIRVAAFASILLVVSRSGLLLATESSVGRWLLPPIPRIFQDVIQGALFVLVGLLTLRAAGVDPGQLLTTSALLTAVVGLALQDTLGNLFSGLALQMRPPFELGDWIDVDGDPSRSGRVVELGWRATRLVTLDEAEIIVPNGVIAKATIRNYTRPSTLERRHVPFACAYGVPPGQVRDVVEVAVRSAPNVCEVPPPEVVVLGFGENAVEYDLWYYTHDHHGAHRTDSVVRQRIWHALGRAGFPIPFPQRDVHLFTQDDARAQRDRAGAVDTRREALASVDLFRPLDEAALTELAAGAESAGYAAGEDVVRQGQSGDTLYVIRSGEVEVLVGADRIAVLGPGAFFGEMSLLTGETRNATVRALRETEVVTVGHAALQTLLHGHPELYLNLSMVLAQRQVAREARVSEGGALPRDAVAQRTTDLLQRIRDFFST